MNSVKEIKVKRLLPGSIAQILFIHGIIGAIAIMLCFGIISLFGIHIIKWNNEEIIGLKALIVSPILGAIIGGLFGICEFIFTYIGSLIFARIRPIIIRYETIDELKKEVVQENEISKTENK